MRILIIEDEIKLAEALAQIFAKNRYNTDIATDGEMGLDLALDKIYDLIVLDIMLPKKNGLKILEEVRAAGSTVPIILLTAKDDVTDKVRGLDLGADDYVTKPFNPSELMARVKSQLRRCTWFSPRTSSASMPS